MKRTNILTGSPWEDKMGYCRAVRVGNFIEVSGTVALIDGEKVKADDAHAQTLNILERIEKVLEDLNAGMKDVIRTRIFVTDVTTFEAVATAHAAFFKILNENLIFWFRTKRLFLKSQLLLYEYPYCLYFP